MFKKQILQTAWSLALLVLLAAPAFAGGDIIYNGVDIWKTPADGSTWQDFADDPIPADFFCIGSEPFTGRVLLTGDALVTDPPDALAGRDTVIHRLDDAVFDEKGVATTRVQVAALALVSIKPIETSCGKFQVRATIASGEQPITEMRIERQNKVGGRFESALEFIIDLTFNPVDNPLGETLGLKRTVRLESGSAFFWSNKMPKPNKLDEQPRPVLDGFVLVDTDGDDKADTFLPGTTSNFFPFIVQDETTDGAKFLDQPVFETTPEGCPTYCHYDFSGSHCHCPMP